MNDGQDRKQEMKLTDFLIRVKYMLLLFSCDISEHPVCDQSNKTKIV